MSLIVERTPRADSDLAGIYAHIAIDSPEAARRFLAAAERTFDLLAFAPRIGRVYSSRRAFRGLRGWPISDFEVYLTFYQIKPGVLKVVRVIHGARDLPFALLEG